MPAEDEGYRETGLARERMNPETYRVFAHLTQEHGDIYRAILEVFAARREHFLIHLRPAEILKALADSPHRPAQEEELTTRLHQLVEWGNLEKTPDRVAASTVEEFYRARFLYQLSEAGEAAESALRHFEEVLHRPGELQTAALRDIIEFLQALHGLLAAPDADWPKIHAEFRALFERFEGLTHRAQTFMRSLQSTIDLHGVSIEDFLIYKNQLLDYLKRFLTELTLAASEISQRIQALPLPDGLFQGLARQDLIDALDAPEELHAKESARWAGKWEGFRRWFLGSGQGHSQSEILRRRAREAIPALLYTVQTINDRRVSRSDRMADWQILAVWFAEAKSDEDAHRLWRGAFAMSPTRHLSINEETLLRRDQSDESPRTSWLDAEPIWVHPRLRASGRLPSGGSAAKVVDTSKERELLARLAADERDQLEQAKRILATNRTLLLSDFEVLNPTAFDLLLDLLGEAMSARLKSREPVEAASTDGSLVIRLEPFQTERMATLQTRDGELTGPDAEVLIQYA